MNLMDYSLLVGIHDCLAPISESEDDDEDWEDGNGYVSDDLIDGPHSPPSSPTIGTMIAVVSTMSSISVYLVTMIYSVRLDSVSNA